MTAASYPVEYNAMLKRPIAAGLALALSLLLGVPSPAADVTVSAAASLQEAFGEIGKALEQTDPATHVRFNFGASGQLVQQLAQGAPADVLATADLETMDRAEQQKLIVHEKELLDLAASELARRSA